MACCVRFSTGEIEYEITTGELGGSWDSRISIRPMREEWTREGTRRPQRRPSEPYIVVECSVAKVFNGQNVYGGPPEFRKACTDLVVLLEQLLGLDLPPASAWVVRRVDVAESYRLPFIAVQEFFSYIQTIQFPRRRAMKYGDHAVYFPGSTTTIKLYHKGLEFAEHDHARLKRFFTQHRERAFPTHSTAANARWVARRIAALQRLANNRLRVEVEIHADKLDRDFGYAPRVHELTDHYLAALHDRDVTRLFREGQSGMDTVRQYSAVADRLRQTYGEIKGNHLFGIWLILAANGEAFVRNRYSRASFYRHRRELEKAGVSWTRSNVAIAPIRGIAEDGSGPPAPRPVSALGLFNSPHRRSDMETALSVSVI